MCGRRTGRPIAMTRMVVHRVTACDAKGITTPQLTPHGQSRAVTTLPATWRPPHPDLRRGAGVRCPPNDHELSDSSSNLPVWRNAQLPLGATGPRVGVQPAQHVAVGGLTARRTPRTADRATTDRPVGRAIPARPAVRLVGARVKQELAGRSHTPQRSGGLFSRTPKRRWSRLASTLTVVTFSSATHGPTGREARPISTTT